MIPKKKSCECRIFSFDLTTEVVKSDIFFRNTQVIEQLKHRSIHQWRAASVVFYLIWLRVVFQVVFEQYLVNESHVSICFTISQGSLDLPIVFWKWFRKPDVEIEVREFLFDFSEMRHVEQFFL